jgi:hypothetical protein
VGLLPSLGKADSLTKAIQGSIEGVWGRGFWRKAGVFSYVAQIQGFIRFV